MKLQLQSSVQCVLSPNWTHTNDKSCMFPAGDVPAQNLNSLAHSSSGHFSEFLFRMRWGKQLWENHISSPSPKLGASHRDKDSSSFSCLKAVFLKEKCSVEMNTTLFFIWEDIFKVISRNLRKTFRFISEVIREDLSYIKFNGYSQIYYFQILKQI